jgi:acetyl esterase
MPLDPQVQQLLSRLAESGQPELSSITVEQARLLARSQRLPPGPSVQVDHVSMPGPGGELALHVYRPLTYPAAEQSSRPFAYPAAEQSDGLLGGLVFFPGGGFVVGELSGHDALCRQLAHGAHCVVVSVDYRLAPEQPFPAAVDDAYAAACFVHEQADQFGIEHRRLAVGGYTAGAALATAVARLAKERRNPALAFQLLIHPITDLRSFDTPSYLEHAERAPLTRATLMWCASQYARSDAERADPRCSPLAAKNLIGLPPALIITAEYDPLRDEAEAYASALRLAHVPVTLSRYAGMVHGFVHLHAFIERGQAALDECIQGLSAALAPRE